MHTPFLCRVAIVTAVLTVTACAPIQKGTAGAAPAEEAMSKVGNQVPFDVAACQAAPAEPLPQPVNMDILTGAMVGARPAVMECLVPPSSRGAAKFTQVVVKASVSSKGASYTVSGDNLTPEGQACVQQVMERLVPLAPLAKGAQPLGPEVEFSHDATRSMAVTLGADSGSDFSGAVRVGQPQWCDCYAAYATTTPPILRARVKLAKGQAAPAEVAFEPATTPEGTALATCLQQKMMALPVNATENVQFTRTFNHFNSKATETAADLPVAHRFLQVGLVRNQRAADTTLAYGVRTSASEAYDALFLKHQKTKDRKLAAELPTQCKRLVEATTKWVGALESQIKTDEEALTILQELKVKEPSWAPAEAQLQEAVARTQEDLAHAQTQLKTDQASCPKG